MRKKEGEKRETGPRESLPNPEPKAKSSKRGKNQKKTTTIDLR